MNKDGVSQRFKVILLKKSYSVGNIHNSRSFFKRK